MEREELFAVLHRGYPFVYQTETLGIKYIGMPVFRDCNEEEIQIYNLFQNELDNVNKLTYSLQKEDTVRLVELFNKILVNGNVEFSEETERESAEKLWKTIKELEDLEIFELARQHQEIVKVFDYRDGVFFRHYKEERNI